MSLYGYWPRHYMPDPADQQITLRDAGFLRAATLTASTKRSPALSAGKRGTPSTWLASFRCTPLDPVDPETRQRLGLLTPHEVLESYADGGLDILEGDLLVVDEAEYPIRSVGEWAWRGSNYVHMIVEELKR